MRILSLVSAAKAAAKSVFLLSILVFFVSGCGVEHTTEHSLQNSPRGVEDPLPTTVMKSLASPPVNDEDQFHFDRYVLKAVAQLYSNYRGLGYDMRSAITHDLPYGNYGLVNGSKSHKTMCVAAQLEVIITAMEIYASETGDRSIFDFLPLQSWQNLGPDDIRGHIWVNEKVDSYGTADALVNFGMGEVVPFEKLRPGSFINFNRASGSGHAVTFIAFLDKDGKELENYDKSVVGFKYFSAQGKGKADAGFGFRNAVFKGGDCNRMPGKHDCNIVASGNRKEFNSGYMFAPKLWREVHRPTFANKDSSKLPDSVFDAERFNGQEEDSE